MKRLSDHRYDIYSQFGEDGIIEAIFNVIGVTNRVCMEFGAWDGFHLSNTANLWTHGWKGVLVECDADRFRQLQINTAKYGCLCTNAKVSSDGETTVDNLIASACLPSDIDFLSIDIDGDDYYIMQSLKMTRPRLIACEYNPTIPANIELIPPRGNRFGCSALSLVNLSESMGYRLVAVTHSNCFFVQDIDFNAFSGYETSLEALFIDEFLIHIYLGYTGEYVLSKQPPYAMSRPASHTFKGDYFPVLPSQAPSSHINIFWRFICKCISK